VSENESQTEVTATVVFADVVNSTSLFEHTGDWEAYEIIGNTLDRHGDIITKAGGSVIRSKGDDLLCTFKSSDQAVQAAMSMLARQIELKVAIRIGVHHGRFIHGRGDIFGDDVNVAARLMSLARPNEGIASAELAEQLSDRWYRELVPFDQTTLKGKSEATDLYRLLPPDDDTTEMINPGTVVRTKVQSTAVSMELRCDGQRVVLNEGHQAFSIGRADDAGIRVSNRRVSRAHATFVLRNGRATLTDTSTMGTWIVTTQGEVRVRREAVYLVGRGQIFLGAHPSENVATVVHYDISGN
jgi:adenylate cyclase